MLQLPQWLQEREFNNRGMFDDDEFSYEWAQELSINSLKAYGADYKHWVITYSGGKDSSALLSFVLWAIESGEVQPPEKLTVLYADTKMELPPLKATAHKVIGLLKDMGHDARIVQPPLHKSFWYQILGRGLPPPKRGMRWCTRVLKAEPMDLEINRYAESGALVLTGVRKGESDARDQRINYSCSTNDGECGQGWFQQSRNALAPLLHWRVCWVWHWLLDERNPLPMLNDIRDVYKADDIEEIRTGCIECNVVDKDLALYYLVRLPRWSHLKPLLKLRALYEEMYEPQHRHRRTEPYQKADGTYSESMSNVLGPLTIEARRYFFARVREIEQEAGYELISKQEKWMIDMAWKLKLYPQHWTGGEPTGDTPFRRAVIVKGELLGYEETMFDE